MTADLAGFLLAQLDADDADAPGTHRWNCIAIDLSLPCDCGYPAFELDRIAALRAVVQQALNVIASFGDWDADAAKANGGRVLWIDVNRRERAHAHATLDALAQPYRGRPGWRDEWGTG